MEVDEEPGKPWRWLAAGAGAVPGAAKPQRGGAHTGAGAELGRLVGERGSGLGSGLGERAAPPGCGTRGW